MNPSPLEIEASAVRAAVLNAWLHESIEAHRAVAVLLCDDAECDRLSCARARGVSTWPLGPTYDALARRYEREVTDGRQLELFSTDQDAALRRKWSLFAKGYLCGRAQAQRWVLEASVGLPRGVGRLTAAGLLLRDALDISLRHW